MNTNSSSEALKAAKGNQKPGQTKEQTKLIAQGIEKGIAEYKKQQKAKSRERDKARKAQLKQKQSAALSEEVNEQAKPIKPTKYVVSLILSWVFFIAYIVSVELQIINH